MSLHTSSVGLTAYPPLCLHMCVCVCLCVYFYVQGRNIKELSYMIIHLSLLFSFVSDQSFVLLSANPAIIGWRANWNRTLMPVFQAREVLTRFHVSGL